MAELVSLPGGLTAAPEAVRTGFCPMTYVAKGGHLKQ